MDTERTKQDGHSSHGGTVLLLGVSFESGNMGIGALAASAVHLLTTRFGDRPIALLDYGKGAEPRIAVRVARGSTTIDRINLRWSWKLFLPNNVFSLIILACCCRIPALRRYIVAHNPTLRAIEASTIAFAVSGGDSFSDIYGQERFLYVSLPIALVLLMGKRLVLLPQTIGPFQSYLLKRVARSLLCKSVRIYSRDQDGVEVARKLILDPSRFDRIRFAYDMAFTLEPRSPKYVSLMGSASENATGTTTVGLNVSGLLMMGGYDRRNMFNLRVSYKELIDSIVRQFCETAGVSVLLIPHVFGNHAESDQMACREVYNNHVDKYRGKIDAIESRHDQHEIKHIIGRCEFFVGARMHACIAALSQGVPAISVAYSRKFAGVLESIGAGSLVVDPRSMALTEIMDIMSDRFADRQRLSSELVAAMPEIRRSVFGMLDDIT